MSEKVNGSFSELRRSYQTSGPPGESYTSLLSIALLFSIRGSLRKKRRGKTFTDPPLSTIAKSPSSYISLSDLRSCRKPRYYSKILSHPWSGFLASWIGSNRRRRHPLDVFWQYPSDIRPRYKRRSNFMEKHINQAILACREFEIEYSGIATGFIIQSQLRLLFRCISNCSDGFQD